MRTTGPAPALLCAVLAGCGGASSGAAVLPERVVPGTAAVTASPPSTAELAAHAVSVVTGYYAEINRASATGDTARLAMLQAGTCYCRRLTATIADLWSRGSIRGSTFFTITGARPHDVYPAVASVEVTYSGAAYDVLDRTGRVTHRTAAVPRLVEDVEIVKEGGQWVVSDVRQRS